MVSTETGFLYSLFLFVSLEVRHVCLQALFKVAQHVVAWAYDDRATIPRFVTDEEKYILQSHLNFWRAVNMHVRHNSPFRPLKLFKHSVQSFYSKTKGGVDGATQQRAVMRSSPSHLAWKQNFFFTSSK